VHSADDIPGYADALTALGFPVISQMHDHPGERASSCTSSLSAGCDVVFLVGAAYNCPEAAAVAALLLRDERSIVVPMYNGAFSLEFVDRALPVAASNLRKDLDCRSFKIVYATTAQGATISLDDASSSFTTVLYTGDGPTVLVPASQAARYDDAATVAELLTRAGVPDASAPSDPIDARTVRWAKLSVNAVINSLTALYNLPNGSIANALIDNSSNPVLSSAANELVCEVSHAMLGGGQVAGQVPVDMSRLRSWQGWSAANAERLLRAHVIAAAEATAGNVSSTRRAFAERRPSELEFILGAVDSSWLVEPWYAAAIFPGAVAPSSATCVSRLLARLLTIETELGCRATPTANQHDFWWKVRRICKSAL
jgi:ketopantoate reductase